MTFLPIVERELRVSARRKSTYYLRSLIGLIAVIIGAIDFLILLLPGSRGIRSGGMIFTALSYYLFGLCVLGGFFQTADCLSEERREGTLGLLFLTDLKGYDVVLGKLLGVSWNAFYGLLAVFPILGLSLVIGGVEGAEFGRVCLALLNTLWFSTTVTLWISSRSESSSRSLFLAALVLLFLVLGLPAVSDVFKYSPWVFHFEYISPSTSFYCAPAANFLHNVAEFWGSLALSHLTGWMFLLLASRAVTRFAQAAPATQKARTWQKIFTDDLLFGRGKRQPALLEINAVSWFLEDSPRLRWLIWGISLAGCGLMIGGTAEVNLPMLTQPFYFCLKVLFAFQSCRFFSETRRNGTLDLLGTTPLDGNTIIDGQWRTLRRLFFWPVVLLMVVEVLCLLLSGWGVPRRYGSMVVLFGYSFLGVPWQLFKAAADFLALGWTGMWLALTLKKPQSAAWMTVLSVLVLPSLVVCVPSCFIDFVLFCVFAPKLKRGFRAIRAEKEARV